MEALRTISLLITEGRVDQSGNAPATCTKAALLTTSVK